MLSVLRANEVAIRIWLRAESIFCGSQISFSCISLAMAAAAPADVITLTKLDIEPSGPTPIDSAIKLNFAFTSTQELPEAFWDFKARLRSQAVVCMIAVEWVESDIAALLSSRLSQYVVDSASKRHVIEMGQTAKTKYVQGENHFEFSAAKLDITGVKPAVLLNVGLLTCTLHNGSSQIVEIKIMTQVSKRKDGVLMRVMFDPLA
jgi:hypothetical protein